MNTRGMPPKLRDYYLKIWNGTMPTHDVCMHLHYLDTMFPRSKLEIALRYLIRNKIVGREFVSWFQETCKMSQLEMHRELMRQVEKENHTRRLLASDLA